MNGIFGFERLKTIFVTQRQKQIKKRKGQKRKGNLENQRQKQRLICRIERGNWP